MRTPPLAIPMAPRGGVSYITQTRQTNDLGEVRFFFVHLRLISKENMMERLKAYLSRPQVWGFFVSVAVLAIISLAFFYPDNFEGNSLRQPDMQQGAANGHEAQTYEAETGEKALWTNALFGGMPTFQITPRTASLHGLTPCTDSGCPHLRTCYS